MAEERVILESMPSTVGRVTIEGMTGTYRIVYTTIFDSDRVSKNIQYEDMILPVSIHNGIERVFMGPHGYRNITLDVPNRTTAITTKGGRSRKKRSRRSRKHKN